MGLASTSNRDRSHGTDSQSACRTYPDRQEASDHHRGHDSGGPDGGLRLFRRNGCMVESSVSQPLVFYGPTEALFASIKVSFLAAVLASLPVIFYQCWKFIEPALLPKEQRWGIPLFVLAGALFASV